MSLQGSIANCLDTLLGFVNIIKEAAPGIDNPDDISLTGREKCVGKSTDQQAKSCAKADRFMHTPCLYGGLTGF